MEQNNTAALNESAGVLPMDTGVTVNGVHGKEILLFLLLKKIDHFLFR
jgi:hypothetical protein